jgi:HSP20 family protein
MFDLISRGKRADLDRIRNEWNSFFDRFLGGLPGPWREGDLWPTLDVTESRENYTVTVELPGVDKKDLDVTIEDDVLIVRGEKKKESEEKDESYHRVERSYGSFSRSLRLPGKVDPENIKAKFKKGVLTLTVPKPEEERGRKIEIKAD